MFTDSGVSCCAISSHMSLLVASEASSSECSWLSEITIIPLRTLDPGNGSCLLIGFQLAELLIVAHVGLEPAPQLLRVADVPQVHEADRLDVHRVLVVDQRLHC